MADINHFEIHWHKELPSTNKYLKDNLLKDELNEFYVVSTNNQVAGKGQGSNKWESSDGKNLTFSLLLRPTFVEIQEQFVISKAISLAIIEVLNKYKTGFTIKWPNDIYYGNKKIAGILIENSLVTNKIGTSVIGIGININQTKFISDAPNPISLHQITNKEYIITNVLEEILLSIEEVYNSLRKGDYKPINSLYLENLYRKDGLHTYKDDTGLFKASLKGISEFGHLILETHKFEEKTFAFKEVEFISEES